MNSITAVMRMLIYLSIYTSLMRQFFKYFHFFIFGCAGSSLLSGFSLAVPSRGYSLTVEHTLIVAASLVAEHRL